MLTIRLKREGKKHQATMRIVVVDSKKSAISNRYVEKIGWWIPSQHKNQINKERAQYWISMGAKSSATVHNLFVSEGVIEGSKIPKHKLNSFKSQPETVKAVKPEVAKEKVPEPIKEIVAKEAPVEEEKEPATEEINKEKVVEEAPVEEEKEPATEEINKEDAVVEKVKEGSDVEKTTEIQP